MKNKLLSRAISVVPLMFILLAILVSCGDKNDQSFTSQKDKYGYERPIFAYLTECLLTDEYHSAEELWGTEGECGILSQRAIDISSDTRLRAGQTGYVVYMIYFQHSAIQSFHLGFSLLTESGILYDSDCVDVGDVNKYTDGAEVTVDMTKPAYSRLSVDFLYEEDISATQATIVIPFTAKAEGRLYVDMLIADYSDGMYVVPQSASAEIGSLAEYTDVECPSLSVGYLTEYNYNEGDFSDEAMSREPFFDNKQSSYMVIDLAIASLRDAPEGGFVDLLVHIGDMNAVRATVEEAPTSNTEITDSGGGFTVRATFGVPIGEENEKRARIILKLEPVDIGICEMNVYAVGKQGVRTVGKTHLKFYIDTENDTLSYRLSADGSYYIVTGLNDRSAVNITVPDVLSDGKPVKEISAYAFISCGIRSVIIGKNVESIESQAFCDCKDLKEISIPDGVRSVSASAFARCGLEQVGIGSGLAYISDDAFVGCDKLKYVTVSDRNANFKDIDGNLYTKDASSLITYCYGRGVSEFIVPNGVLRIGDNAFAECIGLKRIGLPVGLEYIGDKAFYYCGIEEIAIPDTVVHIGSKAFGICFNLKAIDLPASLAELGDDAFYSTLEVITVEEENPYYKSLGGNLYTKDGKELIRYAGGSSAESFAIPDGTEIIRERAFQGSAHLKSVTLPEGIREIGGRAFVLCTALESVSLPSSVSYIGEKAFDSCESLSSIEFLGASEKWLSITKDLEWNGSAPVAMIKCTDKNVYL